MKIINNFSPIVLLTLGVSLSLAFLAMVGCESSDGTDSPVSVTPETVEIQSGDGTTNLVFEASGGLAPYTWSLSDSSLGSVTSSGATAVYTRKAASGINIITATDTNGYAGTAMIYQDVSASQ